MNALIDQSKIVKGYWLGTSILDNIYLHIWDNRSSQYWIEECLIDQQENRADRSNKHMGICQNHNSWTYQAAEIVIQKLEMVSNQ